MKISARDIRVFVGGAFAYQGLDALIWMPYKLQHSRYLGACAAILSGLLGLFVGIGLLFQRPKAIRWAMAILWVFVILDGLGVCWGLLMKLGVSLTATHLSLYQNVAYLITFSALLGLLTLSRSGRFQVGP